MTVRVGVNGFGRIGRNFWRAVDAQKVGGDVGHRDRGGERHHRQQDAGHLLKYDSILGRLPYDGRSTDEDIVVDGKGVQGPGGARTPPSCRGRTSGVDVVIESTGIFTKRERPPSTWTPGPRR
jgi:glyceraldehyde 3-phosphate dehydrogenase